MDIPDHFGPIPNIFPFPTFVWLVIAGLLLAIVIIPLVREKRPPIWLSLITGAAVILSAVYQAVYSLAVIAGIGAIAYLVSLVSPKREKTTAPKEP